MKAIRIHAHGGPDVLSYEDAPEPRVGADDVLVQVRAAGVNPRDIDVREGKSGRDFALPIVPGCDVSGVVLEHGAQVTRFMTGDEVYGRADMVRSGCYAERVAIRATELAKKPSSIDHVTAAAVPTGGLTAWQLLFDAPRGFKGASLRAGETVLVHAAAGGVGCFVVQLAKWRGARVIGTCSTEHVEYLRSIGADDIIDRTRVRFDDVVRDVDVVVDLVGDDTQRRSMHVVRKGGVLLSTVSPPDEVEGAARGVRTAFLTVQPSALQLDDLAMLIDGGTVRTEVSRVFPLDAAREAHELLAKGHVRGKIVLKVL
ncbi:MAG: NADP-dependent oxidoreductase [Polyangiaceae bacterium]|nr:NADP-dependent oxidoreductase [Polyangiaceae bacterium]